MIHESGDLPVMFSIPSYGDIRGMVDLVCHGRFCAFFTMWTFDAFSLEKAFFICIFADRE